MTKTILALLVTAFALSACNTMEGLGKDITKAGEKIEETAKKK
jgi:predicted small secreted protein